MKVFKNIGLRISHFLQVKKESYLQQRIPSQNNTKLNINNTFILPSSFGWSCIGIIVCLFVLGTNFQNNIVLLLCYFLLAMVLLAVFHSYFFFVQHDVAFLEIAPEFENRQPHLPVRINSSLDYKGGVLHFSVLNVIEVSKLLEQKSQIVKIPLPKYKRGVYHCPKVKIMSTYGFGLFKCWTHLSPSLSFYIYPAMQKSAVQLFNASCDTQLSQSRDSQYAISDDLQGIREHQISDPIHHVSWKHVAKGQGMLSKDFVEQKGLSGWLRLIDLEHLGIEKALQCMCYQAQQLDKQHVRFGLDLGKTKILPQEGKAHLQDCLKHLASYELPQKEAQVPEKGRQIPTKEKAHAKLVAPVIGKKL
jgi:uncharacterized protein (DUF58 family)